MAERKTNHGKKRTASRADASPKSRKAVASTSKPSTKQLPSSKRLRRWVKRSPFRVPSKLSLDFDTEQGSRVAILSFPIPNIDWRSKLTPSEVEVVEEVLGGASNQQIARRRGTSMRTIANQIASIYTKLKVRSRLELSLYVLTGRSALRSKTKSR